jgi:hypothetical protein
MLRPGILRTSLVAILVSCVLVCPECWLGALAVSLLGIDHQDGLACACACCVHAGPDSDAERAPKACDEHLHDEDGACSSETGSSLVPVVNSREAPRGGHDPASPASCICQGAIPPASTPAIDLGPREMAWLALPADLATHPSASCAADHRPGDAAEALPSAGGRALRLAIGSLLI